MTLNADNPEFIRHVVTDWDEVNDSRVVVGVCYVPKTIKHSRSMIKDYVRINENKDNFWER